MAGMCRVIPTAPIMIIVVFAVVLMAVDNTGVMAGNLISSLTTWREADCSGGTQTINTCGCTDLAYYAGQEWSHFPDEIVTLTFYTGKGCRGTPYTLLKNAKVCGDYGWRSVNIDC